MYNLRLRPTQRAFRSLSVPTIGAASVPLEIAAEAFGAFLVSGVSAYTLRFGDGASGFVAAFGQSTVPIPFYKSAIGVVSVVGTAGMSLCSASGSGHTSVICTGAVAVPIVAHGQSSGYVVHAIGKFGVVLAASAIADVRPSGDGSGCVRVATQAAGVSGYSGAGNSSVKLSGAAIGGRGSVLAGFGPLLLDGKAEGSVGNSSIGTAFFPIAAYGAGVSIPGFYGSSHAYVSLVSNGIGSTGDDAPDFDVIYVKTRINAVTVML